MHKIMCVLTFIETISCAIVLYYILYKNGFIATNRRMT